MLYNIEKTCINVIKNSNYVKINYNKLDDFISNIHCENLQNWLLYNPYNILDIEIEKLINFLFIFESIDYSFWGDPKWTIETSEGKKDGSDALLYSLLKYIRENNKFDFSKLSFDEFKKILKGNVEIPLLKERYKIVINNSNIINEKMNGNFYKYICDIKSDIELFNIIVNNFPSFKDERIYKGEKVYFYKLAQLLTSDILHLRERLEKIEVDYSNLIGCADYKIPQTLRALGIIEYSNELADVIDNKHEIEASSEYEVEIRASQIVVLEYIKNKLKNVKSIDINDYLFVYSKKVNDIVKPYHLCRNINY